MIPKIIHYCWFGRGKKPKLIEKCIRSWKKYCPDYEIIEWNEDNFDVNSSLWTAQAYKDKKWAFVSDYVRLYALKEYGGIYLDTDQELLKSIDFLLDNEMFMGYQNKTEISAGFIGAKKGHPVIKSWLEFCNNQKNIDYTKANTEYMDETLKNSGADYKADRIQKLDGITVYPRTYFSPLDMLSYKTYYTGDTVSVHHFAASWRTNEGRKNMKRTKRHSTKAYKIYEQIIAYPIAAYRKIFKKGRQKKK